MRLAITAETSAGLESPVAGHFGHAPYFVLVDVEEDKVTRVQTVANPYAEEHRPGQVPLFVRQQQADVVITGGMGERAYQAFSVTGIKVALGAQGTVQQALTAYLEGRLTSAMACWGHAGHHDHDHAHNHGHGYGYGHGGDHGR